MRAFRLLLGLSVLTLILPVAVIAVPGGLEALQGGDDTLVESGASQPERILPMGAEPDPNLRSEGTQTDNTGGLAADPEPPETSNSKSSAPQSAQSGDTRVEDWQAGHEATETDPPANGSTHDTLESALDALAGRAGPGSGPTTSNGSKPDGREPGKSKSTKRPNKKQESTTTTTTQTSGVSTSTTSPQEATTSTTAPVGAGSLQVGDVITGEACPCTITDTVALVGDINLKGDITVKGGTLVARAGVKLQGNGHEIAFMEGGRADFQGTEVFTWSDRGQKVNLQRDINFDNLSRIMFHAGARASTLKYFSLSNSGITDQLGFYPLHWHLNGEESRGTLVEGVVVLNGRNHAFVPHGSNGITIKDSIARNIIGTAFWWDRPGTNNCSTRSRDCTTDNSNDSLWDHNLVDGVVPREGDRGIRLAGFLLGAGSGNVIRNSAGINIHGNRDCSAFHWPEWANLNIGGNVWNFRDNFGESDCHGIFVWQNGPNMHPIDGFSGGTISHGAYNNRYIYSNFDVTEVIIHARGWRMENGQAGDVTALKHQNGTWPTATFDNVTIESFTVNNAENGGSNPGQYILNGSGLGCEDIVYANALPGTEVVLDGKKC